MSIFGRATGGFSAVRNTALKISSSLSDASLANMPAKAPSAAKPKGLAVSITAPLSLSEAENSPPRTTM
ncbi:hypothetical protein D3C72_2395780 [compost metagenome]